MHINEAMRIRRCIKELASGGKTLDELAAAVGLYEVETKDGFEAFVLMLVVANLVDYKGERYVLSEAFLNVAKACFVEVYGGKTVYVKQAKGPISLKDETVAQVINELFGSSGRKGSSK